MHFKLKKLLEEIEHYRYKMYELADGNNFTDPEVIGVNQHLDKLINEYNKQIAIKSGIPK